TVKQKNDSLSRSSDEESPDFTLSVNGSNSTSLSTVLVNGLQPLATSFINAGRFQATIPVALHTEAGHIKLSDLEAENSLPNAKTFPLTETVPAVTASVTQRPSPTTQTFAQSGHLHYATRVVTALDEGVAGTSPTFDVIV